MIFFEKGNLWALHNYLENKISCRDVMHHVATMGTRKKTAIDFQKISLYG